MRTVLRTPVVVSLVVVLALAVGGCADDGANGGRDARVRVVAGFYPFAEAARRAGGDGVEVIDLTPNGGEAHDLEITTDEIDDIASADVVLVMGHGFQPAVEDAAQRNDGTVAVLDELPVDAEGDVGSGLDPHVWLDPVLMRDIVDVVADALIDVDASHAARYRRNASEYDGLLGALDRDYREGLATCERRTMFTAHAAFGWMARRYDLRQQSIAGITPDAEPTPDRIAQLADEARDEGATTIYTEPLVPDDIARTLAREAGDLRTAALDPLEALTRAKVDAGDDYVSVMRDNLHALRDGLACE
jgi:zinc transport system substrate-binding protein